MKKILLLLAVFIVTAGGLSAQNNPQKNPKEQKVKVKKTSTIPQKVHNTFSKNKKYKGYKVKHKVETKKAE